MTKEVKYSIIRLILGIALYVGEIITVRRIELDMVFVIVWLLIVHFLFSYGAVTAWIQNIKKKKILEENLLMLIATMGAFGIGMLEEAVAVMLFFQVGTTFQQLITDRSKQKIAKLMDIRPVYATRKVKGQEIRVEPGELKSYYYYQTGGKSSGRCNGNLWSILYGYTGNYGRIDTAYGKTRRQDLQWKY